MGVTPKFGAKVYQREDGGGVYPDVMEDICVEWGDEMEWVGFEGRDLWDVVQGVSVDKFFLCNPEFLTVVVDYIILVRVLVCGKGTGGGSKKVRK